jgi:4-hydroxy-tetrahydrodipicolinate synthase
MRDNVNLALRPSEEKTLSAIGGVNVVMVGPRRPSGHEVDLAATLELIDFHNSTGVKGLAVLGTTAEFVHLDFEERTRLIPLAVKRAKIPVVVGVTHSTLDGSVLLGREAAAAGAAALLLMPPYFFRYAQEEIREFYLRFADEIGDAAPIFLYNIPFFTNEIAIETALGLLSTGRFAGIKDSSGKWEYYTQLRDLRARQPFTLLIGNDSVFTRARVDGADGVISGVACGVPELMVGLDRAISSRNTAKIELLEARLQEYIKWLGEFPTPLGVKETTAMRGLKVGANAIPLAPARQRKLEEFREWFKGWLPQIQKEVA